MLLFLSVVIVVLSYSYYLVYPSYYHLYVHAIKNYPPSHSYHYHYDPIKTSQTILDIILGYDKYKLQQQSTNTATTHDDDEFKTKFMNYSIFDGHSSLRNILKEKESPVSIILKDDTLSKSSKALLLMLLLLGYGDSGGGGDVAHEIILGVTSDSIDEAEYAATHRGQTNWTKEHPFSDVDDIVHSILHRIEGHDIGEGSHTGYENAKYWISGGPKCYETLNQNLYRQALCQLAILKTPISVQLGVIVQSKEGISHQILSSGGGRGKPPRRHVFIPHNCWDPIRYIDLCSCVCSSGDFNDDNPSQVLSSTKTTTKVTSLITNNSKEDDAEEGRQQKGLLSLLLDEGRIDIIDALRKELEWLHYMEIILLFMYENEKDGIINFHDDDVDDIVEMCCKIKLPIVR